VASTQRSKPHYRAVFISDLHLGAAGARTEAAIEFLSAITCDQLYLVGDIFDGYVGRHPNLGKVSQSLQPMLESAPEVFYTPGNHDSFMRRLNGSDLGRLHIDEYFIHETALGTKLLVIHGDQFDKSCREGWMIAYAGAWAYEGLTRLNQALNRPRLRKGRPPLTFAAQLKHAVKGAVKKGSTYEIELLQLAKEKGCEGVICGHVHRPESKQIGTMLYLNTGDWVENHTALLEYGDGRIELTADPMETVIGDAVGSDASKPASASPPPTASNSKPRA
jgi:UDP-2,3-diacylglucosamine pyrophosphatase LpxH